MEKHELRIGNLFLYDGIVKKVAEVRCDEIMVLVPNCAVTISRHSLDYKGTQPIPLTEDWLKMFGFDKKENSYVWQKIIGDPEENYPSTLQFTNNDTAMQVCRSGIGAICAPCKYVHQLQNLYFALTGQELTITGHND